MHNTVNTNAAYQAQYRQRALTENHLEPPTIDDPILLTLYRAHFKDGVNGAQRAWESLLAQQPNLADLLVLPRRRLYHVSELQYLPRQRYLLDKEIPEGGLTLLYGPSGSGKTFVGLDYGLRIAQKYPVVYVLAEGLSGLDARIRVWCQEHGVDIQTIQLTVYVVATNLLDEQAVKHFVDEVQPLHPKLVVFDTLARCMSGGDENSSRDMGRVISSIDCVRTECEAAVLVVHHTGKSGDDERGHSSLRGASDQMISVKGDNPITLSCSKSKDDAPFETRYLERKVVTLPDGSTSCVLISSQRRKPIVGHNLCPKQLLILQKLDLEIFQEAGATKADLKHATEIAESTLYTKLSDLKAAGYIRQGKKGDPYKLTDKGKALLALLDKEINQRTASNGTTSSSHGVSE